MSDPLYGNAEKFIDKCVKEYWEKKLRDTTLSDSALAPIREYGIIDSAQIEQEIISPIPMYDMNYKYCCATCDVEIYKNPVDRNGGWDVTGDYAHCEHLNIPVQGTPTWDSSCNSFVYPTPTLRLVDVSRTLIDKLLASGAFVAKGVEAKSLFKKL